MSILISIVVAIIIYIGIRRVLLGSLMRRFPYTPRRQMVQLTNCFMMDLVFCLLISYLIGKGGGLVFRIDSLRNLRTWAPFLGIDTGLVDFFGQYIEIPEIERSEGMQGLVNVYGTISQLSSICVWGSLICGVITYLLLSAKRGKSLVVLSICVGHAFVLLACYCGMKFYNSFSSYLWGIGGQIRYLYILAPTLIYAIDIYRLSLSINTPGMDFRDSWLFDRNDADESSESEQPGKGDYSYIWGIAAISLVGVLLIFAPQIESRIDSKPESDSISRMISDMEYETMINQTSDIEDAATLLIYRFFTLVGEKNFDDLFPLLSYCVEHYHEDWQRLTVVEFWKETASFSTSLDGELEFFPISNTAIEVHFNLKIESSDESDIIRFYMVVGQEDGRWKILGEGLVPNK